MGMQLKDPMGTSTAVSPKVWWWGGGLLAFAVLSAIGASKDDSAPSQSPDPVFDQPTPAAMRAWLSPDGSGGNCQWLPGLASDYGDPVSFCDYPAP